MSSDSENFPLSSAQAWAVFKGKFKEGDKAEPATWKTRLRCALNKSPDFEEVTERSQLDISEPYKVYRIVPEEEQKSEFACQFTDEIPHLFWESFYTFVVLNYRSHIIWSILNHNKDSITLLVYVKRLIIFPSFTSDGKSPMIAMATSSSGDITDMDCSPAALEEFIKEVRPHLLFYAQY